MTTRATPQLTPVVLDDEVAVPTDLAKIIARLAHEGVPIRAIARSFKHHVVPIRDCIRDAIAEGVITAMPRDDWPPGVKPEERNPSGVVEMTNNTVADAISHLFKLTAKEAMILTMLVRRPGPQSKEALLTFVYDNDADTPELKIIDVFICKVRKKLEPHGIFIETIWGRGYMLDVECRAKIKSLMDAFRTDQMRIAA